MPKYKVGIDFTITGIVYVKQEADSEDEAAEAVECNKDERVARALETGDGHWDTEVVDVIPERSGT